MKTSDFLRVLLDRCWPRGSPGKAAKQRYKRRFLAICLSLCLHLLVLDLMLLSSKDAIRGLPSPQLDGGVSAGEPGMIAADLVLATPQPSTSTAATRPPPDKTHFADHSPAPEAEKKKMSKTSDATTANPVAAKEHQAKPSVEYISNDAEALTSVAPSADGQPNGTQDILSQIARCLPPDVRPALTSVKLDLQFDEQGQLAAVPRMEIDLAASSEEQITQANLIVQAVLQCGPYDLPQHSTQMYSLVADFSKSQSIP